MRSFFKLKCPACFGHTECPTELKGQSISCPHCTAEIIAQKAPARLPRALLKWMPILIVLVYGGILGFSVVELAKHLPQFLNSGIQQKLQKPILNQETPRSVSEQEKNGNISIDPARYRAFVNPVFWSGLDAKEKENFTMDLAAVCAKRQGDSTMTGVEIFDQQSGKRLAAWGIFGRFIASAPGGAALLPAKLAPTNLKTEGAANPVGLSTNTPKLTWTYNGKDSEKGFQIIVASSLEKLNSDIGDMWDTGHVWQWDNDGTHAKSVSMYTGKPLAPGATYYWKVKIWDGGNYWINGGDSASPFSTSATFSMSASLIPAKRALTAKVFGPFLDPLYANTYWSIVGRVAKDGYNKESGPENGYAGEFSRSCGGAAIASCLATRDYATAEKSLRFLLQACKDAGVTRAPHVISQSRILDMLDQADGNYHVVNYWAKYISETGDVAMENDFYPLIRTFVNNYLNSNFYSTNYGLLWNPNLEHSREAVYEHTYDLINNIFAAEALRSMIPIARRRGDVASASLWTKYLNNILDGIAGRKGTLKASRDGLDVYREELLYGGPVAQTVNQPSSATRPVQNIWGISWVNLSPVAVGGVSSPVIDTNMLYNTLKLYERQGDFMWGDYRVPLTGCTPGWSNCTVNPNNVQYAVIGKGLAWEIEINRALQQWNRLNHLCEFVETHTTTPLYPESFWYPGGHSDFGNLEQAAWWIWAMTHLRDDLCKLYADDFENGTVGSVPPGWTAESGAWQVFQDPMTSKMLRATPGETNAVLCVGQADWTDYSVTANVKARAHDAAGGMIGVGGRCAEPNKFYALLFNGGKLGLYKYDGDSQPRELAAVDLRLVENKIQVMKIKFAGTTIKGFWNNELILCAKDSAIASGKALLLAQKDDALFDRVLVKTDAGIELESQRSLAFNRPASAQSGTHVSSPVDWSANTKTFWEAGPYPQWWQVDLEDAYDVNKIIIRNYVDGRYYHYTIEASLDGKTWTQVAAKTDNAVAINQGDTYRVQTTCRYLRVNMTYNSANIEVRISDFRAYGRHHMTGSLLTAE